MLREYLTNIANAIRSKLGEADKVNAQDFADKIAEVYDKGVMNQRKNFWNIFTDYGKRTNYNSTFNSVYWDKRTFQPTVCIKPITASSMFSNANGGGISSVGDNVYLEDYIAQFGGSLDWSECTNYNAAFQSCTFFRKLRELDFRKVTAQANTNNMSAWCGITQVDVMKFAEDGSTPISNTMFYSWTRFGSDGTTSIDGTIGYSINLSSCPNMTVGTMKQIITHLANYYDTDKEATCKITMPSTRWEALESDTSPYDDGLTDNENLTWKDYIQTSLGWLVA